jgi:tetratricopeptide (TPR) repeat protein
MDGRTLFVFGAFALGVCTGCVPNANKNAALESPASSTDLTAASAPSINLFGDKQKKAPSLELSYAAMRESNARRLVDQPEKQYSEFDEARKIYQEILNYEPNCIDAYRGLGRVYIGLSHFDRAEATFKKALEKQPNNAAVYAEFSIVYSKRNLFPEAIKLLSKATEIDPENQEYQRMLGVDCVCNGDIDRGLAAMTRARGPAAAHYYVARVYERKGRDDLAKAELAKALEANPNLHEARAMLEEMDAGLPRTLGPAPTATRVEVKQASYDGR